MFAFFWRPIDCEAQRIWDLQDSFTTDFFMGVEIEGMMQ